MITFKTSNTDEPQFIRVPLQTFATESTNQCTIHVYNYYMGGNVNEVVMGAMFFYDFYGFFTNAWQDDASITQQMQLYVSNTPPNKDYVYLGTQGLPQGPNPFVVPDPSPNSPEKNGVWIGILVVLVLLLISIIAFILFKLYTNK